MAGPHAVRAGRPRLVRVPHRPRPPVARPLRGDAAGGRVPHPVGLALLAPRPLEPPAGRGRGLPPPIGTSLAFTDATPWWSTLFRPLSPLLPAAFQIHG